MVGSFSLSPVPMPGMATYPLESTVGTGQMSGNTLLT